MRKIRRFIWITLSPVLALLAILAKKFFEWVERELNYVAFGGR